MVIGLVLGGAAWTGSGYFVGMVTPQVPSPGHMPGHMPGDAEFDFEVFYDRLREKGYVIYPGKLTVAPSFRIGCIGDLGEAEMKGALDAITEVVGEMGVRTGKPDAA